jgi:hypothetical protein
LCDSEAREYIYLLWIFYRLLSGVSRTHASLMVIFGVAFVPIMCMNAVSEIAALMLPLLRFPLFCRILSILAMAETRQYNFATSKSLALRFAKNAPCVRGNMQT